MNGDALAKVRAIIVQAYGRNLDGSDRGPLVSAYYLARIRDVVRELAPVPAVEPSAEPDDMHSPELCGCDEALALRGEIARLRTELAQTRACGGTCAEAVDLRARLVNIYRLTLTGGDADVTLRAVRAASSPGAPAPAREYSGTETQHGRCGFDCLACAAGAPPAGGSHA